MIKTVQTIAVTAVKPSTHGAMNVITPSTMGMYSTLPACFIAAESSPDRKTNAPSTYAL